MNMRAIYILCFIFFISPLQKAHSSEGPSICARLFQKFSLPDSLKRIQQASQNYIQEVRSSKGASLILSNPKEPTVYPYPLFALPEPNKGLLSRVLQKIPNKVTQWTVSESLDFRPGQWFIDKAIQSPTRFLTEKVLQKPKELSALVLFLASLGTYVAVTDSIYDKIETATEIKQYTEIQKMAPEYEMLLVSDYRFSSLKDLVLKIQLSKQDEVTLSYQWNEQMKQFYSYIDSTYMKDKESGLTPANEKLLYHTSFGPILFNDIIEIVNKGLPQNAKGFIYQPEFHAKLNADQINKLIHLRTEMLMKMELVSEFIFQTHKDFEKDAQLNDVVTEIKTDPFVQQLFDLYTQGKISQPKLRYLIQEDLYWKNSMAQWNLVGLVKLKKQGDNYTPQPLTIQDIQKETLAEIHATLSP